MTIYNKAIRDKIPEIIKAIVPAGIISTKNINEIKSIIDESDPISLYSSIQGHSEVKIGKFSIATTSLKTSTVDKEGYSSKSDLGYTVVLNTEISNELYQEGIAREFVHNIQNLRREAGLEISDKITVMYSESNLLENVITKHDNYIKSETLCEKIEKARETRKTRKTWKFMAFSKNHGIHKIPNFLPKIT